MTTRQTQLSKLRNIDVTIATEWSKQSYRNTWWFAPVGRAPQPFRSIPGYRSCLAGRLGAACRTVHMHALYTLGVDSGYIAPRSGDPRLGTRKIFPWLFSHSVDNTEMTSRLTIDNPGHSGTDTGSMTNPSTIPGY